MIEILTDRRLRFLKQVGQRLRWLSISSTTAAGSGHPTSCLSSADIAAVLFFGGHFRGQPGKPQGNDDRFILSKGHAAPLIYACAAVAGDSSERSLATLRSFTSNLQGHPMPGSPWTEVPTGSLGQGLGIGIGMAWAARYRHLTSRIFVLMGDSELAEGSVWEAAQLAGHHRLHRLITIVDVNGLGQRGPTMAGHHLSQYAKKFSACGWRVLQCHGHSYTELDQKMKQARTSTQPTVILAKTQKGYGVPFLTGKSEWHGRALTPHERDRAKRWLSDQPLPRRPVMGKSIPHSGRSLVVRRQSLVTLPDLPLAPRQAAAMALHYAMQTNEKIIALDAEVGNSTGFQAIERHLPKHFFQGYISEQTVVGASTGIAVSGLIPVAATFGAFWTRAADQLRMAGYSNAHQVFFGTHAGVHIGQDGPSQMALEDIALFRGVDQATVFAASDDVSAARLAELTLIGKGVHYLRLPRAILPRLYSAKTRFVRGGSQTLRASKKDQLTIIAHGVTVHQALQAADELGSFSARVIDAYSIQPLDEKTIRQAAKETGHIIVVEDHRLAGGLGEAVARVVGEQAKVVCLAVTRTPRSGTPEQLLRQMGLDARAITHQIRLWQKHFSS